MLSLRLINSCNVEKRIARKQARWCNKNNTVDTVIIQTHDTTTKIVTKTIKLAPNPDTLNLYAIAYCDSMNKVQMPAVILHDKANGHQAAIQIVDNKMNAEIICNMDSLEQIILEKDILIKNLKNKVVTKTNVLTKIKKTGRFYIWFFWILVVLVLVSTALYLVRWYYLSRFKIWK